MSILLPEQLYPPEHVRVLVLMPPLQLRLQLVQELHSPHVELVPVTLTHCLFLPFKDCG